MKTEDHPTQDEEYSLPPLEALVAGTLALMTGYAQHQEGCDIRPLMAHKLARNLSALAQHPAVSEPMQTMLGRLVEHWLRAAEPAWAGQAGESPWARVMPATLQ